MAGTGAVTATAILRAYFNNTALTLTNNVFADLVTTQATATTPGVPLSYTGYVRTGLTANTTGWTVGSNPVNVTNATPITWSPQVPSSVTTPLPAVVGVVLYGSLSGTDMLYFLDIPTLYQKQFTAGDVPTLPAQALVLTLN